MTTTEEVDNRLPKFVSEPHTDGTRYRIFGEMVPLHDICRMFSIGQKTFVKRARAGVPPEDAATISEKTWSKLHPIDSLVRGWKYWCAKESIPLTDLDMRPPILTEGILSRDYSLSKSLRFQNRSDRSSYQNRSGFDSMIYSMILDEELFGFHKPEPVDYVRRAFEVWFIASTSELGIHPVRRVRADAYGHRPRLYPDFCRNYFDPRVTIFLPPLDDYEKGERRIKEHLKNSGILLPTHRPDLEPHEAVDLLGVIGAVVYHRRLIRERYCICFPEWVLSLCPLSNHGISSGSLQTGSENSSQRKEEPSSSPQEEVAKQSLSPAVSLTP